MPTETISPGVPTVIAQTTSYALPAGVVFLQSTVVLETAVNTNTFTAVAATTTGVTTAARFVRCTTSTATVMVKKYN